MDIDFDLAKSTVDDRIKDFYCLKCRVVESALEDYFSVESPNLNDCAIHVYPDGTEQYIYKGDLIISVKFDLLKGVFAISSKSDIDRINNLDKPSLK